MSEHDLIIVLFVFLPLMFCGGVWCGIRLAWTQARIDAQG